MIRYLFVASFLLGCGKQAPIADSGGTTDGGAAGGGTTDGGAVDTATDEPRTYEAELGADNAVTVTVGGDTYVLRTQIRGEGAWGWSRSLTLEADRLLVVDTLTGAADGDLGVSVSHQLTPPREPVSVHIAGAERAEWSGGATNPSTLLTLAGSQLGTVAADAPGWTQFRAATDGASVETGLPGVHLPAGGVHTLALALYPLDGGDYWDFINRARRDFAPSMTVPAWEFGPAPQWWDTRGALEPYLAAREIDVGAALPFLDYDNYWIAAGYDLEEQREGYLEEATDALEKIHAVDPELAVLTELEGVFTQLTLAQSAELIDLLPLDERGIGYPKTLNAAQQGLLEGWGLLESMPLDDDGFGSYELYVRDGAELIALLTYPEVGTGALARFEDQVAFSLDTVGAGGAFVDGGGPVNGFLEGPGADGVTARVDPVTGALAETRRDYRLTLSEALVPVYQQILDDGGFVAANGYGYTPEMTALPVLRFMETGGLFDPRDVAADGRPRTIEDLASGHLGTPVALGNVPDWYGAESVEFLMRDVIARLAHGLLYAGYNTEIPEGTGSWDALNAMFPITPLTLHPGWIVGAERTVTAVSGDYAWAGEDTPIAKCFGLDGAAASCEAEVGGGPGAWTVALTLDDWDQVAVIDAEPAASELSDVALVAFWPMDGEGAIDALEDSAGDRDLDGVLAAPRYASDDPPEGSAYAAGWDGATTGLYAVNPGFVDPEEWTLEIWFRRADAGSAGCLFGNGHVDDYAGLSRICVEDDGVIRIKLVGDAAGVSGNPFDLLEVPAADDAAWRHLALVWSGGQITAYIDHEQAAALAPEHYAGRLLTDYAYLTLGFANDTTDSPGPFWAGDLDGLRLAREALGPERFLAP